MSSQQKEKKVTQYIICTLVYLVMIIAICLYLNPGKTIDLNKYLLIYTTGYDGSGQVAVGIDWKAIEKEYGKKIDYSLCAHIDNKKLIEKYTTIDICRALIKVRVDEDSHLSNHDIVNYSWEINDKLYNLLKIRLKYENGSIEITSLPQEES